MQKSRRLISVLTLSFTGIAFSGVASAEIIVADPAAFAVGTDVTHAYEGASLFQASANQYGEVAYRSVYTADCNGCKPAVDGQRLFAHELPSTGDLLLTFGDEMSFAHAMRGHAYSSSPTTRYGSVLLADFNNATNYLQVVGTQGHAKTNFYFDVWDESFNFLARCAPGQNSDGCFSRILSTPLGGTPNQGYLPLWELSFYSETANIGFVSMGGSDGPGYVKSVAYSVPEPAPMALLALGVAGLLIGRRRIKSINA